LKPLTESDLAWLENRIGAHRWTPEDCRRMLADLRAANCWGDGNLPEGKQYATKPRDMGILGPSGPFFQLMDERERHLREGRC
jgi:hypothetical protein